MVVGDQKEFIHCKKCRKRLIARMPDGSGEFIFGKQIGGNNKSPVTIRIWGLVEIGCLSLACDEVTKLSFFPTKAPENTDNLKKQSNAEASKSPVTI